VAGSFSDAFLCLLGGGQVPWVKQVHPRWCQGKNPQIHLKYFKILQISDA